MIKINFVSNPNICIFKMYYSDDIENECIDITPDQIPELLLEAIGKACKDNLVLALKIFIDVNDDTRDYVHAIITGWDGICVYKKGYKLFGDGSFDIVEGSSTLL